MACNIGGMGYVSGNVCPFGEICGSSEQDIWKIFVVCNFIWFLCQGDFRPDSDIDIMILVGLESEEVERYEKQLSWATYDFNEEHDIDIKPIVKSDLKSAVILLETGEYKGANNRAYYTVYHAISAVPCFGWEGI